VYVIRFPGFLFLKHGITSNEEFIPVYCNIVEIRSSWVPREPPLTLVIAPNRACFVSGSMQLKVFRAVIILRALPAGCQVTAVTFCFTEQWAVVTSLIQCYVISGTSAIHFANYPPSPPNLCDMCIVTLIHLWCACHFISVLSVANQGEFLWQGLAWRHKRSSQTYCGTITVLHWMTASGLTFLCTKYFILTLVVKLHTFKDLFQSHMNIYLISYQPLINVHFVYVVLLWNTDSAFVFNNCNITCFSTKYLHYFYALLNIVE